MLKRKAVGMVAETLASSGDVFTRDDDLELVGDAIPFGLKLYESLLDSAPTNKDLLIATCSNFTRTGSPTSKPTRWCWGKPSITTKSCT